MKLLILSNNTERASFRQRIGVYLDRFKEAGIDYEIAKLPSGVFSCRKVFLRAAEFDAVFLHKKGLNPLDAYLLRRFARKIIFNYDDAVMFDPNDPQKYSNSRMSGFKRSIKAADLVIVGSGYLAEQGRMFNKSIEVLPLGLDTSCYHKGPERLDGKVRLVWIGSSSTKKYLEIIREALELIGSRYDNVVFRMICDDFLEFKNIDVEKCLWSPQTRYSDIAEGDIGLAPLPGDRFTMGKCSFKVLEYSASGLPVVASPIGTNQEHLVDGVTGFFASDIEEWIEKISDLIEDKQLRAEMGKKGIENAACHDVKVIGHKLVDLIKSCV
jgi:glycosyltransferase involved in cell wall biosynthesis